MSLNIKNPRVHALARAAAAKTGKTQTGVIEEALEKYLADIERAEAERDAAEEAERAERWRRFDETLEEMRKILAETGGPLSTDFLYDEDGLPA
ncbi:type II toxin-antitoxin system VapB family antitoxin [Brevibacterium album]|uniref:type II toxin-antitoxin system VapB family antitoxin n=1 Tax=Brevibacterium album TaxID=417948 RepID=UPI00055768B6|nr:type II toxin-antitoxin system VapB family antitoxin [Brevibacterium album]